MKERFSIHDAEQPRDVSIPEAARALIQDLDTDRIHWIDRPLSVAPDIWITGPIPRAHPLEDTGGPFYLDRHGIRRDPLQDDLSLWLETDGGLVVVTGCCHSGIVNTIDFIQAQTGGKPVQAIVGGLHLHSASPARLEATVQAIRSWGTPFVTACHCTGVESTNRLQAMLGPAVIRGYAGLKVLSGGS
jgi:7,8-dihydropterin-6-yl-methyl-4-(beta-D-ribofuranosyl)aminobenzene 5'-phosphate synthase